MTQPLDRVRLAKLLGLLGSAHDGERDNAARFATDLVRESGETWETVLKANGAAGDGAQFTKDDLAYAYDRGYREGRNEGVQEGMAQERASRGPGSFVSVTPRPGQEWRDLTKDLIARFAARTTNWEKEFLTSFLTQGWPRPTPRQRDVFERIANKCDLELPE